jgi:hypothetical protein
MLTVESWTRTLSRRINLTKHNRNNNRQIDHIDNIKAITNMTGIREQVIKDKYYDPLTGFVGVDKLYHKLKRRGFTRKEIQDFLDKQEVHVITRKNNQRSGSFIPQRPKYQYQIDLIYFDNPVLNKAKYGFVAIDTFTKQGHAVLLKDRKAPAILEAMQEVIDTLGKPESIYSDEGVEFTSKKFKQFIKDENIDQIFTLGHASMIERWNRTLKEMLQKYLDSTDSKTIINVLPKMLTNYNNSYHSTIKMKPNEVDKSTKHIAEALANIQKRANTRKRVDIEVGDRVRVQKKVSGFNKGYRTKWRVGTYEVEKIETVGGVRFYHMKGLDRKYLRSEFEKQNDELEKNEQPPELDNTIEGTLKSKGKKIPNHLSPAQMKTVEETGQLDALIDLERLDAKDGPRTSGRLAAKQATLNKEKTAKKGNKTRGIDTENIVTSKRRASSRGPSK